MIADTVGEMSDWFMDYAPYLFVAALLAGGAAFAFGESGRWLIPAYVLLAVAFAVAWLRDQD